MALRAKYDTSIPTETELPCDCFITTFLFRIIGIWHIVHYENNLSVTSHAYYIMDHLFISSFLILHIVEVMHFESMNL
jgi:hypothetical protein